MSPYIYEYARPALTIDVVGFTIRNDKLKVLLVQRGKPPYQGQWALPGGFVNMDKNLEEAGLRKLEEETGVKNVYLEQLYTYGDPNRDPRGRVVTVAYFTIISTKTPLLKEGGQDASQTQWFPVDYIPSTAFDHSEIINYTLRRLRFNSKKQLLLLNSFPRNFRFLSSSVLTKSFWGENLIRKIFAGDFCILELLNPLFKKVLEKVVQPNFTAFEKTQLLKLRLVDYSPDAWTAHWLKKPTGSKVKYPL